MPSYGAAPHDHHNPSFGGDQISQSEAQQLARKLTRKDETIQHLSERNQELNAEVERLKAICTEALKVGPLNAGDTSEPDYEAALLEMRQILTDMFYDGGDHDE